MQHIPHNPNARRAAGFTLIEALAAGVILAISALAIGTGVSQSVRSLEMARDYQHVASLLDQIMVRVDLIGPDRIYDEGPWQGQFGAPDDRFSWEIDITSLIDGYLYEVDVTVRWMDRGVERSQTLSTRLNDPPRSRDASLRWEEL